MSAVWKWIVAGAAGLVGLLVLLGSGIGGGGTRLTAYLRKRDDAEAKARAAANESLAKLQTAVDDANREVTDAARASARGAISNATR